MLLLLPIFSVFGPVLAYESYTVSQPFKNMNLMDSEVLIPSSF